LGLVIFINTFIQPRPSSKEEAGSQRGAKAGGEDEVDKSHFPGQAGRLDEMGECGTMQDMLARPLVHSKKVGAKSGSLACNHRGTTFIFVIWCM